MARVLVVDNHDGARNLLLTIVREHFDVCDAQNGRDAISRLKELHPDVIVLDLLMPEMGGMEVALEIRKIAPETKIVLISGCLPPSYGRAAARLIGAEAYVEKHTAIRDLVPVIRAVLRQ